MLESHISNASDFAIPEENPTLLANFKSSDETLKSLLLGKIVYGWNTPIPAYKQGLHARIRLGPTFDKVSAGAELDIAHGNLREVKQAIKVTINRRKAKCWDDLVRSID